MKAITLKQPWASLVASGLKQVENRTWAVPRSIRGERIAIHAGKGFDPDGLEAALFNACCCGSPIYHCLACDLFEALDPHQEESRLVAGRIVCTARIVGQYRNGEGAEWFVNAPCFACEGTGSGPMFSHPKCEYCEGTGQHFVADMTFLETSDYCGSCAGIGEHLPGGHTCLSCRGSGQTATIYNWILADVELVSDPTIYRGKLGIWELPADALKGAA